MKTLLVVDDESSLIQVIEAITHRRRLSRRHGGQWTRHGLLDFMMPVLDGAGVLKAMEANSHYGDVPVVIMSSLPEATIAEQCQGYVAFLRKPFSATKLIETIQRILSE